ncbi:MAG: hypothetical protein R3F56_16485 [Planctomycetota bacterium]
MMSDQDQNSVPQNSVPWLLGRLDEIAPTCADADVRKETGVPRGDDDAALFARLRRLGVPASRPEFALRVRYAVARRAELRGRTAVERAQWWARGREALRVACVAALLLGAGLLGQAVLRRMVAEPRFDAGLLPPTAMAQAARPVPGLDAYFEPAFVEPARAARAAQPEFFERFDAVMADVGADSVLAWLGARNELDMLRAQFRQRFSREGRQALLALTGATPAREERIQHLAARVATQLEAALAGDTDPCALALGLRALLAAGSSRSVGEHRHLVCRVADRLLDRLAAGESDETSASILAAVTDMAVVSDGRSGEMVRDGAERIARATVSFAGGRRPDLLHRQARLASLADAGYVLRLAPAFGAPAALCARARRLVLAHLRERLDVVVERPDVVAAILYGFGDLVDHGELDTRLLLWGARRLLPDYVALFHYAWGHYPVRRGWSNLQDDLRYLSTLRAPEPLEDASALLLTLAMNFAAPGSYELLARR